MSSFSSMLAPGFNVRNESNIPILVVLSQISPLHWCKVEPGESKHMDCGRVFFTVSVEPWMDGKEPTRAEVAARLALVIGTTVLGGGFLGFTVSGLISGLTSVKGLRMSGVYANGRTMVIRGQVNSVDFAHVNLESETLESRTVPTGVYQLYIHGLEWADKSSSSTIAAAIQPLVENSHLQSDSTESQSLQSQSTIHFDRSDNDSPSPQSPLKIASVETHVVTTHPFYSEESVAKEVAADGNEENEVVFSILGEEDNENFEHTADYIQQS